VSLELNLPWPDEDVCHGNPQASPAVRKREEAVKHHATGTVHSHHLSSLGLL
jgi:hypothetical protein